jgi:hypothetical protein
MVYGYGGGNSGINSSSTNNKSGNLANSGSGGAASLGFQLSLNSMSNNNLGPDGQHNANTYTSHNLISSLIGSNGGVSGGTALNIKS